MHGVEDESIPIEAPRDPSSRIADSRLVAIDGSDHSFHIDASDWWIEEVSSLAETLP